ncbi:MAG: flagellar biosynthesis anti-sigma factor FlgM [Clostridia bacterium]|nr:flagellar biosynthesis anti-sigma factor FlgM [Clostridia bacterium]
MKINGIDTKHIARIYGQSHPKRKEEDRARETSRQDTMDISPRAREIQRLVEKAEKIDVTRLDKVEELRDSIKSGKYRISSEELADKLIQYMKDNMDIPEGR